MTSIVVQKYGGSSVADVSRIRKVAARIAQTRSAGKQVCVVVSAMGSTTDELLSRAREIASSPPRRELDMLLTCGERASMALLSMAVSELGYEAISFTGSQCGILTDDRHSGARIIEVRPFRVADELERGKVVIVAGFQGVSYKREITTLGRGGSDTTAVALAGALGAEYCEICSDVDGVYTADPRVVDAATLLRAISHDEMLELSTHGARVLHASAVEYAQRVGIALYARATDGGGRGTRIDRDGDSTLRAVGVTGQRALVHLRGQGGALETFLAAAVADSVPLSHLAVRGESLDVWVDVSDVPDWNAVGERLVAALGQDARLDHGAGSVSIVRRGLGGDAAALADAMGAARSAGVVPAAVATSPLRVTLFCREEEVDALTVAAHHTFCE